MACYVNQIIIIITGVGSAGAGGGVHQSTIISIMTIIIIITIMTINEM